MPVKKIKEFYLLLSGTAVLVIFLKLPANEKWYNKSVARAWGYFGLQKDHMSEEYRMAARFGSYYTISTQVAEQLSKLTDKKEVLLLVPPAAYFKQHGVNYHVPEPAVFYYFTGVKTIWANSPDAATANWFLRVADKKIVIENVTEAINLQDSITAYNKYPSSL